MPRPTIRAHGTRTLAKGLRPPPEPGCVGARSPPVGFRNCVGVRELSEAISSTRVVGAGYSRVGQLDRLCARRRVDRGALDVDAADLIFARA
jgi:hypothetical protein